MPIKSLIQQIFTPDEVRYTPVEIKPYTYFSEVFAPIYAKSAKKDKTVVKQDVEKQIHAIPVVVGGVQKEACGQYNPISKTISVAPEILNAEVVSPGYAGPILVHEYTHALDRGDFPITEEQYSVLDQAYPGSAIRDIYKRRYKFALPKALEAFKRGEQRAINNELRYQLWKRYSAEKKKGAFSGNFNEYIDSISDDKIEQLYRVSSGYYDVGGDPEARKKALKEIAQNNYKNPYEDKTRTRA